MFYNTTHERGDTLQTYRSKAETQQEAVLEVFVKEGVSLTPFEVLRLSGLNCPVTSIRRAISDLEKKGMIVKSMYRRSGEFGRMNNTWKLKI